MSEDGCPFCGGAWRWVGVVHFASGEQTNTFECGACLSRKTIGGNGTAFQSSGHPLVANRLAEATATIASLEAQLAAARGEVEREVVAFIEGADDPYHGPARASDIAAAIKAGEHRIGPADAIARGDYRAPRIGGKEVGVDWSHNPC